MRAADYDRAARNLREFLGAFDDLFSVLHRVQPAFSSFRFPQWVPKAGMDTQAKLAAAKVTRLAGSPAKALQVSGCYLDFKPAGTWQTKQVNPVLVWSTMLSDDAMLDPRLMSVVAG